MTPYEFEHRAGHSSKNLKIIIQYAEKPISIFLQGVVNQKEVHFVASSSPLCSSSIAHSANCGSMLMSSAGLNESVTVPASPDNCVTVPAGPDKFLTVLSSPNQGPA